MNQSPKAESGLSAFCDATERWTYSRCHKRPGHEGNHTGWAHYPGNLVSWENTTPTPPERTGDGD